MTYTNFTSETQKTADSVELILHDDSDNTVHYFADKKVLAAHSDYFKAMFYGKFREAQQDVIELKDVNAYDFLHLLYVIFPMLNEISGSLYVL